MRNTLILFCAALFVQACGTTAVNKTYISNAPADAKSFAVATRAVKACADLTNTETVRRNFQRAGFGVSIEEVTVKKGRTLKRTVVSSPDPAVSVLLLGNSCYVGLESMTPNQSRQLANIWVDAHGALPNSAFGDGLSDHLSGAWRRFFDEAYRLPDKAAYTHKIYVAAYKTWPHGAYAPQRRVGYSIAEFPRKPGAAVKLTHVIECRRNVRTGPRSGAYLPCSGTEYRPK